MESSEGTVRDERRGEKVRFGPKGSHKTARLYFLWLVASGCLRLLLRPTAASASKRREIQDVFVSGHSAREWRDVNAHLVCALHQNCLRAEDLSFFPPNRSLFLSFFLYLTAHQQSGLHLTLVCFQGVTSVGVRTSSEDDEDEDDADLLPITRNFSCRLSLSVFSLIQCKQHSCAPVSTPWPAVSVNLGRLRDLFEIPADALKTVFTLRP
jgi:hypothetical protein